MPNAAPDTPKPVTPQTGSTNKPVTPPPAPPREPIQVIKPAPGATTPKAPPPKKK